MNEKINFTKINDNEIFRRIVNCNLELITLQQQGKEETEEFRTIYKQVQNLSKYLAKRTNTKFITITDKAYRSAELQVTLQKVL